jgi:uncharacterized surface protein with fasciclin (FAS1) repeats
MSTHIKRMTLYVIVVTITLFGCRKKAFDEYYGRPDNLEPPIYQVLETKGNFKHLLAAIDKAGYKRTLAGAGYWTFFAPHDSAFQVYFTQRGITGVGQMDSVECRRIVTYSLVYNAFRKERLGDYQSPTGWVSNTAFKRRTAYYTGIYDGVDTGGKAIKAIAANRNSGVYIEADNNNKYIPYFVDNFMASKSLTAADYNYFFPGTPYTGFNVVDANVTQRDIPAENGIIHVVNKVITSLPSIDEYLGQKPEYSLFKSFFDEYLVQYVLNQTVTNVYQNASGSSDNVFTKVYDPLLAYSLNNENFLKQQENDGQNNTYSIFVPTNDVMQAYIDTLLLANYPSLDMMPRSIIVDFINAHLWQNAVWPSKFATTFSFVNEEARFNPAVDIIDKKLMSNGIFYGTKKIQDANVFSSVFGKPYLDPNYTMMITLLNNELKPQVSDIYRNYTIFLMSNQMLNNAGYIVDISRSNDPINQWSYTPPGASAPTVVGADAKNRLLRILNLHVIPNRVLNDLAGEGVAMSYGGEYIAYKNGQIFAAGNVDSNHIVTVGTSKTAKNGRVYYSDKILEYSVKNVGLHIEELGTPAASQYNYFWQYLRNSTLWNNTLKDIQGIANGTFFTLFIPNNAAITQAVNDGFLPGTGTAPNKVPLFNPPLAIDKLQVARFIHYHFLNKRTIAADGVESGGFETVLKTNLGDPTNIFVTNTPGMLKLIDMNGRNANVISPVSSYLSNRCVIHLTDNYLQYRD